MAKFSISIVKEASFKAYQVKIMISSDSHLELFLLCIGAMQHANSRITCVCSAQWYIRDCFNFKQWLYRMFGVAENFRWFQMPVFLLDDMLGVYRIEKLQVISIWKNGISIWFTYLHHFDVPISRMKQRVYHLDIMRIMFVSYVFTSMHIVASYLDMFT